MKYVLFVLLGILGVLILLLAVAAVRALMIRKSLPDRASALKYTDAEEKLYAERLSEMIRIPTVSLRGNTDLSAFYKLHEVMKTLFPLIHEKLERTEIEGNLLYRWQGKDSKRDAILLMGHQDVVPAAEKDWKHEPFSGDIENGRVYGRGAMDCKCTVMAEFSAVEELLKEGYEPPCDVYLSASVNEEISGDGAPMLVAYLKQKGVRLSVVVDEGGAIMSNALPGLDVPCAAIGIVEKGYADVKIKAKSHGGHSSTPPKHTPIARLSDFVSEIERKQPFKKELTKPVLQMFAAVAPYMNFPMRLILGNLWLFKPLLTHALPLVSSFGQAFVATTCVFTMSGGAKTANVIPDEAYVICNMRPGVHQNSDEAVSILEKYAKKHDLEVEVIYKRDASNYVDIYGEEFQYMQTCLHACFPQTCVTPYYMTGGTDCRNYEAISDNCLRFCPIRLNPAQLSAMHAANENVDTDALAESVKFYKYFIKNHP